MTTTRTPLAAPTLAAPIPSARSHLGLDLMLFFLADVRDGLSPFFAMFLGSVRHWSPGAVGLAFALSNIASAVSQVPAGVLVDGTTRKRLMFAISGAMVALGVLLIALVPGKAAVFTASVILGIALAVFHPITIGLSLGIVGRRGLAARVSRNETFNHAGNFLAALLIGVTGWLFGLTWIFILASIFALASAAMAAVIPAHEIDHRAARGDALPGASATPLAALLRRRDLIAFLAVCLLFYLGNGAMLPLASEALAAHHASGLFAASGCIMAAQLVMTLASAAVGRAVVAGVGRKTIFLVALAVLPLRGLLLMIFHDPLAVVAVQALDGIGSGIFGVASALIAADLMQGTGRVNLVQGAVALAVSLGASASNLAGGLIAQYCGYDLAFLVLSGAGLAAVIGCAALVPETGPRPRRDRGWIDALFGAKMALTNAVGSVVKS
ncbi:MFS transporter [Acidibrevibacterium fodinaquatile]|uniref:MFS transporter n=1 Tax=Acidibrevibacterium fodinaquatile TaxID=1969806 RepID=UPI000E0D5793|nr:MFS transporter [Acidibrevibacterium fodinaquatile]